MTSYIYDMVDTWNAGATTFTAVKMNVTDTASAAGSLLMDLQVGGSSKFRVGKDGNLRMAQIITATETVMDFHINSGASRSMRLGSGGLDLTTAGSNLTLTNTGGVYWPDIFIGRRAAANLRLGAADAAAPVAQTLSVQSVVAGTTNTAGANFTITGSQGTGTGAGGSIIFQVAPAGSSGTAQNALATALTIAASKVITVADTYDLAFGTTTGTKIGTATTQKIGFYNNAPVVQPTAVADATDNATAITQLNALLSRMRDLGLIAT